MKKILLLLLLVAGFLSPIYADDIGQYNTSFEANRKRDYRMSGFISAFLLWGVLYLLNYKIPENKIKKEVKENIENNKK